MKVLLTAIANLPSNHSLKGIYVIKKPLQNAEAF